MTAYVGTARPTLPTLLTTPPPRPVCPTQAASGRARAHASSIAHAEMTRCSVSRLGMPFWPDQFAGSVSQAQTALTRPHPPAAAPTG